MDFPELCSFKGFQTSQVRQPWNLIDPLRFGLWRRNGFKVRYTEALQQKARCLYQLHKPNSLEDPENNAKAKEGVLRNSTQLQ
jgi:hypothetical protein